MKIIRFFQGVSFFQGAILFMAVILFLSGVMLILNSIITHEPTLGFFKYFVFSVIFFAVVFSSIKGDKEQAKLQTQVQKMIEEKKADIYIDGEPISNKFNINGIELDEYIIKIDGNNVYLKKK